jgi:hypothetical protein
MATRGVLLSENAANRIARVVRRVERMPAGGYRVTQNRRTVLPVNTRVRLKITSNIAVGVYYAKSIFHPITAGVGALTEGAMGTLASSNDLVVWEPGSAGAGTALPLNGLITEGEVVGADPDSGRPIVIIPPPGVRKLRFNSTTKQLQAAYIPSPSGDSDWVDMVEFFDYTAP